MEIKKLYTFDIKDGKVIYEQKEYKVSVFDNLYNVYTMDETFARLNMPENMYKRIYGETVAEIVENRKKWLVELILPDKMESLNDVTDEIHVLSNFLNYGE